jgi:hypothetical protein
VKQCLWVDGVIGRLGTDDCELCRQMESMKRGMAERDCAGYEIIADTGQFTTKRFNTFSTDREAIHATQSLGLGPGLAKGRPHPIGCLAKQELSALLLS